MALNLLEPLRNMLFRSLRGYKNIIVMQVLFIKSKQIIGLLFAIIFSSLIKAKLKMLPQTIIICLVYRLSALVTHNVFIQKKIHYN
ncbi:unnamed protein product [Commensalibacter communis]|nr:unnamed protein product [Commensalibacter communis]CAI3931811.1 unnamed protein product [Commensalibacter communis]